MGHISTLDENMTFELGSFGLGVGLGVFIGSLIAVTWARRQRVAIGIDAITLKKEIEESGRSKK